MAKPTLQEIELAPQIPGLRFETEHFSISVAPTLGGKITSLINKATRREFLSRTRINYRPRSYGDNFNLYEKDGADECFPSVQAVAYPTFPWQGVCVPDHGELWTLPWKYQLKQNRLHMWVQGVRFPYVFERRISFEQLARKSAPYIRLSYSVQNLSPFPFSFVYAFHPLFQVQAGCKILLPAETKVVSYCSTEDRLGPPMFEHPWPNVRDVTLDKTYDRQVIRSSRLKRAEKLFTTRLKQGRCALKYPNGEFIGFLFPAGRLPFLGIWISEGGLENLYHVALEPSTAQVDRLDIAEGLKDCGLVPPNGTTEWDISLITGVGEEEMGEMLGKF